MNMEINFMVFWVWPILTQNHGKILWCLFRLDYSKLHVFSDYSTAWFGVSLEIQSLLESLFRSSMRQPDLSLDLQFYIYIIYRYTWPENPRWMMVNMGSCREWFFLIMYDFLRLGPSMSIHWGTIFRSELVDTFGWTCFYLLFGCLRI
jgi:hypothetical protein